MLHRPYFFKAVATGSEPLLGPYAASFTTCVTSARKHTRLVASLLNHCPQAACGWWYFICKLFLPGCKLTLVHAYTAAVTQYTVLRRVPQSMMADDVRADFLASHNIIEQMSQHSGMARRALPMLNRLREKIRSSATAKGTGLTPADGSVLNNTGDNALLDLALGTLWVLTVCRLWLLAYGC